MRFSLPSGRRAKSALLATLATASVACAPSIAHAQVFAESWEPNVSTKWVASSTVNTYNETGTVSPIRNSVVDEGPAAACAGRYAREVTGTSGGRMYTKPGLVIKNNTDYCLMAYIRRNGAGAPYLGINFEPSGTTPPRVRRVLKRPQRRRPSPSFSSCPSSPTSPPLRTRTDS